MSRVIMFIPTGIKVGLTSIILGIIHAIEQTHVRVKVFKPIALLYNSGDSIDQTTTILRKYYDNVIIDSIYISSIESLFFSKEKNLIFEKIIANFYTNINNTEVLLVEGLSETKKHQYMYSLNCEIANILNAEVVLVAAKETNTLEEIYKHIRYAYNHFLINQKKIKFQGVIVNKLNAPINPQNRVCHDLSAVFNNFSLLKKAIINSDTLVNNSPISILGVIPWNSDLITIRVADIACHLNATILNQGNIGTRCVNSITFCSNSFSHILENDHVNSLLVISSDRYDLLVEVCLAMTAGIKIGAILLTDNYKIDNCSNKLLFKYIFSTDLPILTVNSSIFQVSLALKNFELNVDINDYKHIKKIQEYISKNINSNWIKSLTTFSKKEHRLFSPIAFRHQLTEMARKANKNIILPEGEEPRTLSAAVFCTNNNIANCVLLGNPDKIHQVALSQGIKLHNNIKIINPAIVLENYISHLVKLRKNKGMTEIIAREQLKDNVVLGTLMLEKGEVDGLVSGAIHTTANTIRPALQLIKTASGNTLVSSIFFMLLPEQVFVYGDCAINKNPTAEQLAEIAIQSADSAIKFGIEPYIAMLSYSTGLSGSGSSVEKVREATRLVREKRADLFIDGPLQYDAAVIMEVAKYKMLNSPVAGRSTVFIFPDLNSGNITYKAVQRSANIVSVGPMLQGMRKPVNDLSRGASVNDIIYTIALTAVQSS